MKRIVSALAHKNLKAPSKMRKLYKCVYIYRTQTGKPALFEFAQYDQSGEFICEYKVYIYY